MQELTDEDLFVLGVQDFLCNRRSNNKSEPKEKLIFNKDKWIIGSAQIKKYKESLGIKVCPVTKLPFGAGMDVDCKIAGSAYC